MILLLVIFVISFVITIFFYTNSRKFTIDYRDNTGMIDWKKLCDDMSGFFGKDKS